MKFRSVLRGAGLTAAMVLMHFSVFSQTYISDRKTIVFHGTHQLEFPFAGGLNTPQFSSIDLNHDGKQDLFIFDRTGNKPLTFINEGSTGSIDLFYWPEYESIFPSLINWAILLDYNCDGEPDLITSDGLGVQTYLASYDGFSITYIPDQIPLEFSEAGFDFELGVGYIDIPGFADVNFDGDIDVLTFNLAGGIVDYYENMQIEDGLECGTWTLEHVNSCWGNFFESGLTYSVELDYECKGVTKTNDGAHAGSTFMIFDQDNDHDMDVVLGDLAFGNLNFLVNGGDNEFAHIIDQDTTYPSNTLPYDVQIFPAPFLIDMNNDGKKDMMVAPNNGNFAENFKNVWYYENISDDETYVFDFVSDSLLVSDMIDVGDRAFPAFFDYNYDGLMDLVIGNKGYFNAGDYVGKLALYENTGTTDEPAFTLITRDFAGLSAYPFDDICPAFYDLDNDGDIDMLIGEEDGPVHYFENIATPDGPAVFNLAAANYQGIDPGKNSTPALADINKDGLIDLILGEQNGNLNYYENTGTLGDPEFTLQNEFWGNVDVRVIGSLTGHSVPEIYSEDGTFHLFVGSESGTIFQYEPAAELEGAFTVLTSSFNNTDEGSFASVRFADINNDGMKEMITGNERGGVSLYRDENASEIPVDQVSHNVLLFPNPSNGNTMIQSDVIFSEIEIIDMTGKVVLLSKQPDAGKIQIDISDIPDGIYIVSGKKGSQTIFRTKLIKAE